MIKIDLHVHTIPTVSDAHFTFSLDRLKEYVTTREIDCIAITNHNVFSQHQFSEIQNELSITVLPGIEIDLAEAQLLLIGDGKDLEDFNEKCLEISKLCPTNNDSIELHKFKEIFPDLSKYILIPHYDKKPKISSETLSQLKPHVTAGEVTNPKKFSYCMKDRERLVPVFFSDFRSCLKVSKFPFRQTYLSCEEASFSAIKSCLRDKNKVSLSRNEGKTTFQIFEDGQELSTGLNVIVGERSTGKSKTLDRICDEFSNVKYIRQFSLVAKNEEEDERRFNKILTDRHSLVSKEYLDELQGVVLDVIDIDLESDERAINKYLETLLRNAKESEKRDAFSCAKIYSEEKFQTPELTNLQELIDSTKNLIKNEEFREILDKHIPLQNLRALYVDLMQEFGRREEDRLKKIWLNDLINDIKDKLQIKSAVTKIEDIDLFNIAMNLNKIEKFEKVIELARTNKIIVRRSLKGFEITATASKFEGVAEIKKGLKITSALKTAFEQYSRPYVFLQALKNVGGLTEAEFYKCFVKIEYKIINKDGFEVSGGERSEFNLLQELEDAKEFDMLLIDEPESSFDNIFLKEEVNELIKDISRDMPVVLVTHNSTVGASIKPDYLLCTKKEVVGSNLEYRIYSGYPTNKELFSPERKSLKTWDVLMGCLEAGETTYYERGRSYEDIKN